MNGLDRVVIDNNVLVSRLLRPSSVPAEAVRRATRECQLLTSEVLIEELASVLARPRFDKYVSLAERQTFLRMWLGLVVIVDAGIRVDVCRDKKDNHVLEAALNGNASMIITGDDDLLELDPFRNVRIVQPAEYLRS